MKFLEKNISNMLLDIDLSNIYFSVSVSSGKENKTKNKQLGPQFSSVQFSSVTQSCLTLCNLMDCSMP